MLIWNDRQSVAIGRLYWKLPWAILTSKLNTRQFCKDERIMPERQKNRRPETKYSGILAWNIFGLNQFSTAPLPTIFSSVGALYINKLIIGSVGLIKRKLSKIINCPFVFVRLKIHTNGFRRGKLFCSEINFCFQLNCMHRLNSLKEKRGKCIPSYTTDYKTNYVIAGLLKVLGFYFTRLDHSQSDLGLTWKDKNRTGKVKICYLHFWRCTRKKAVPTN